MKNCENILPHYVNGRKSVLFVSCYQRILIKILRERTAVFFLFFNEMLLSENYQSVLFLDFKVNKYETVYSFMSAHFQFQVYMNAKPAPKLSELLFLTVIGHLAKVTYTTEVIFYWLLRGSCYIRSIEIGVQYWNFHRILNFYLLLIFSWKKILRSNFAFWETFKLLRSLDSKEIKLQFLFCFVKPKGIQ